MLSTPLANAQFAILRLFPLYLDSSERVTFPLITATHNDLNDVERE
jgi:hypothetical protein